MRKDWTSKKLGRKLKIVTNIICNTVKIATSKEQQIIAFWWAGVENNWGDALNPVLIQNMTGKKPILSTEVFNVKQDNVYSVIGSILERSSERNLIVWGSGFTSSESKFKVKPKEIHAVRGPRTRELVIKNGVYCPEVYGDPAMLYPIFYKPKIEKKYKLGIIPHYVDQDNQLLDKFKNDSSVLIINILSGIKKVVDNICSCEKIASSSLHGIIAADSYGIPAIWIKFSNKVSGNGFKFYDYFESVGRTNEVPLTITQSTTLIDIINYSKDYRVEIDMCKLVDSCPFITNEKKTDLIRKINEYKSSNLIFND